MTKMAGQAKQKGRTGKTKEQNRQTKGKTDRQKAKQTDKSKTGQMKRKNTGKRRKKGVFPSVTVFLLCL